MPVIIFGDGKMDKGKKGELIRELTEASTKVTGIDSSSFTIYIHENDFDSIGGGGELLADYLAKRG